MHSYTTMTMSLDEMLVLVEPEMKQVNTTILSQLNSDVVLINQLGHYIVDSGGKRIRPIIALLAAKALNYQGDGHILTAAFIEFIHTATLLHDDVVDESELRRGKLTANTVFGNAASVLVGDYIYTRSFQMMTRLRSFRALEVMSKATNVIAEGEVQQLLNCNNIDITEEEYLNIIYSKTARLFESAAHVAAIISNADEVYEIALQQYGRYMGTAFQLIDDVLDYDLHNASELGKNLGDDLSEGKPTLPLLYAMQYCSPEEAKMIRQAIEQGGRRDLLDKILSIMKSYDALEYVQKRAEQEAQKAADVIAVLPESIYKTALINLSKISVSRRN